ncbi:MAG: NepR family anti-sigma factor [Pseudomonadota bacterium]
MSTTDSNSSEARERRNRAKRIGESLKKLYDDVTQEDIPEDFFNTSSKS